MDKQNKKVVASCGQVMWRLMWRRYERTFWDDVYILIGLWITQMYEFAKTQISTFDVYVSLYVNFTPKKYKHTLVNDTHAEMFTRTYTDVCKLFIFKMYQKIR